jgi:hypothetical protein
MCVEAGGAVDGVHELVGATRLAEVLVREGQRLPRRVVARQDDARRARVEVAHARQESGAAHPGHPHVGHDDVGGLDGELVERRIGIGQEHHVPVPLLPEQQMPEVVEDLGVVIDEKHANHRVS